jgi:hypothetical protein
MTGPARVRFEKKDHILATGTAAQRRRRRKAPGFPGEAGADLVRALLPAAVNRRLDAIVAGSAAMGSSAAGKGAPQSACLSRGNHGR